MLYTCLRVTILKNKYTILKRKNYTLIYFLLHLAICFRLRSIIIYFVCIIFQPTLVCRTFINVANINRLNEEPFDMKLCIASIITMLVWQTGVLIDCR